MNKIPQNSIDRLVAAVTTRLLVVMFAIVILLPAVPAYAARAYDGSVRFTQPDGDVITLKIHGDEAVNYKTTLSGMPVIMDEEGYFCYAEFNSSGDMVPGQKRVKSSDATLLRGAGLLSGGIPSSYLTKRYAQARISQEQDAEAVAGVLGAARATSTSRATVSGNRKVLVILASFLDKAFGIPSPNASFTNMFKQDGYSAGGAMGSVREYYYLNSKGVYNPQFTVVGPVVLPQNMAFYGANNVHGNDQNPRQMVIDACTEAVKQGVNMSQFDNDGDGLVDGVYIIYAGYSEAEHGGDNTIWPHKYNLSEPTKIGSSKVYLYACSSELRNYSGYNMSGMGTFCHEYAHILGLPDMYDADGATNGTGNGLSDWSVMDYGCYANDGSTPPFYTAIERTLLGWLTPKELTSIQNVSIKPIIENEAYTFKTPNTDEFYIVESRLKSSWDTYLPQSGLLVYHIDRSSSQLWRWTSNRVNANASHECARIKPAIGYYNSTGYGYAYPFARNVGDSIKDITSTTTPNTLPWGPGKSGDLVNISNLGGGVIGFTYCIGVLEGYPGVLLSSRSKALESIPLLTINIDEETEVSWTVDGTPAPDASISLSAGVHEVRAEAASSTGVGKDIIIKRITVQ